MKVMLSELLLARLYGRAEALLDADASTQKTLIESCVGDATVPELAKRIVHRTVYAQVPSRLAPVRELVQNAIDASGPGERIDVLTAEAGSGVSTVTVVDRGPGMTRSTLLAELLVPFQSSKTDDVSMIGEHGIGFLSTLSIARRIEVRSRTSEGVVELAIEPVSKGPAPHADFTVNVERVDGRASLLHGTEVRLELERPLGRGELELQLGRVAGLVDLARARIYVNGSLVNTRRQHLQRPASAEVEGYGPLTLALGRGDVIEPCVMLTQAGLLVSSRSDPFCRGELALHREIAGAITSSGRAIVIELPLGVPLNKGRTFVAAFAARAVERAIVEALERFVLQDALGEREILGGVDHRLGAVVEKLVNGALRGDPTISIESTASDGSGPPVATVAAPEALQRFAAALVEARHFTLVHRTPPTRTRASLREVLAWHRAGRLGLDRAPSSAGTVCLDTSDPLAASLVRRIGSEEVSVALVEPAPAVRAAPSQATHPMPRIGRTEIAGCAASVVGTDALGFAMAMLERIDLAIATAGGLAPSPVSVHQDLYGPDEMAHTDGTGISLNFASARVRRLLDATIRRGNPVSFAALVDLMLHEKTHVSLATYAPRAAAEHGETFYRRKDLLRRKLLEAVARGSIVDPFAYLRSPAARPRDFALPDPASLSAAVAATRAAA